ncbi:MAG: T9SS type A sorting domain-containing protein [Bacteroidales bacterium]
MFNSTGLKEVSLTITRYGCTSFVTQTIDVVNVKCGKNNNKILVCHTPPGNPENPQTICISPNAVPAHLAHGDCVGKCLEIQPKSMMNEDNRRDIELFSAYPNPFKNSTVLSFILSEESHVLLQIYNCTGQKVATLFNNTAKAGKEYRAEFNTSDLDEGMYIAILKSDTQNKIIKLSIVK